MFVFGHNLDDGWGVVLVLCPPGCDIYPQWFSLSQLIWLPYCESSLSVHQGSDIHLHESFLYYLILKFRMNPLEFMGVIVISICLVLLALVLYLLTGSSWI